MWLQVLIGFKHHPLLWVYPIYFMNLPLLWAYTCKEANTPSLMRYYLFSTVSGEIRLAQPSSPGQHRSSAFPPLESLFFSLPHSTGWVPVSAPHRAEGSKPNFHSCYGKYKIQLHTSLPPCCAHGMHIALWLLGNSCLPPVLQKLSTENANGLTDQEGQWAAQKALKWNRRNRHVIFPLLLQIYCS